MRYARSPSWVYVMLIVMGIGFSVGAFGFILFVPQPTGAIVGAIWLVMGTGMEFFSLRALRGRRDDERIRREGSKATATLLSANTNGWVINGVPQWVFRLRVDGLGAPYETTLKMLTYTPPANGATFGVRVDPLRRDHVVLADDDADATVTAPAASAGSSAIDLRGAEAAPQVRAAVLAALQQAGLAAGETAVVNPDGSRTITSTSVSVGGDAGTADTADTVRLLAELDRMRANGSLSEAEFDAVKRKLLGEA